MGSQMTLPVPPRANGPLADRYVVVQVEDRITSTLAGHDGCTYQSPPQPRDEAVALIRILLGRREEPAADDGGPWTCPIAGGRRTVTLRPRPVHGPIAPSVHVGLGMTRDETQAGTPVLPTSAEEPRDFLGPDGRDRPPVSAIPIVRAGEDQAGPAHRIVARGVVSSDPGQS